MKRTWRSTRCVATAAWLLAGCRPEAGDPAPPDVRQQTTAAPAAPVATEAPCPEALQLPPNARCGTVQVYENRESRAGRTIDLSYVILPAKNPGASQPDPVFALAGGPGQAATQIWPVAKSSLARVHERHDLVFVDQRGTGASNGLRCPVGDLEAILAGPWDAANSDALVACGESLPADLTQYATPTAMDDLDDVRAALGYDQINVWGGSYGTRAALVYLRQHGDHVRSATLWGVAPPGKPFMRTFGPDGQAALEALFEDCSDEPTCKSMVPDGKATVDRILARLQKAPVAVELTDPRNGEATTVQLTADMFIGGLRLALYDAGWASPLPATLAAADQGRYEPLMGFATQISVAVVQQIHIGMFMSVACAEDVPLLTDAHLTTADQTFVGGDFMRSLQSICRRWPAATLPAGYLEPVRSDVPVLLMAGALDPVTPPSTAEEAAATLSNARVVPFPDTGHGTSNAAACEAELIGAFVEDPDPAKLDVTCTKTLKRPPFVVPG